MAIMVCALVVGALVLCAWTYCQSATKELPAPDHRARPDQDIIDDAANLLRIALPATDAEINAARVAMYPRAPGDCLPDGRDKGAMLFDVCAASDLLIAINAFDANPPKDPFAILERWHLKAHFPGRVWASLFPPPRLVTYIEMARHQLAA